MKAVSAHLVCGIAIILALVAAGCVAPPQGNQSGPVDLYKPGEFGNTTTPTLQSYVTEVTPFVTEPPRLLMTSLRDMSPRPRLRQTGHASFTLTRSITPIILRQFRSI